MRLIAILLALWANQHPGLLDRLRDPEWFHRYARWMRRRTMPYRLWDGAQGLLLLLIPPLLAAVVLQAWVGDWLLGLGELLLAVPALLFAFGPDRSEDHLARFRESWVAGDLAAARRAATELNTTAVELDVADERLPEAALRGLFGHAHERLFAPVFWLVVLGPAGAFAYRIVRLARIFGCHHVNAGPAYSQAAGGLDWLVSWIPARLAALGFALAGSFTHSLEEWRRAAADRTAVDTNSAVLGAAGVGALGMEPAGDESESLVTALADARGLVRRSLLVWLAVVAVLTITGWIR